MDVSFRGSFRKFQQFALGGGSALARFTGNESLATAQVEPARLEWSRAGYRFVGGTQIIANGIAPVAAIPTTTATLALYNSDRSQSLVIERLGFFLGSGTPAAGATMLACVSRKVATAVTAHTTGYNATSANGSSVAARALWGAAVTIPAGSAWFQVQSTMQLAAVNVGQGESPIDLEGAIIIPPECALGIVILSGAGTTPLYGISATWSEVLLELE